MAFSLIANAAAGASGGDATTGSINTTGADFIVALVSEFNSDIASVTDSKSNKWTSAGFVRSSNNKISVNVCYPTSVGSGHTFSTSGGSFASLAVLAFSGSLGQIASLIASASTSVTPGTITFGQSGGLIIAGLGFSSTNTISINGGFTISDQVNYGAGAHMGIAAAYLITTSGSNAPTWSWGSSTTACAFILSIQGASAGGGSGGGSYGFA